MEEPQDMQVPSLGREDPLEEGLATHSRILTWRIPGIEEPDRLQSIESQRVRQNEVTQQEQREKGVFLFLFLFWGGYF